MKIGIIGAGFFSISNIKLKKNLKTLKFIFLIKKVKFYLDQVVNQFRWHKGIIIPDPKRHSECLESYKSFKKYLNKFTLNTENYYAIAKEEV